MIDKFAENEMNFWKRRTPWFTDHNNHSNNNDDNDNNNMEKIITF